MFNSTTHQNGDRRRRFGLAEVLLIVGILGFGAFVLVNYGHQTFGSLLTGFDDAVRG